MYFVKILENSDPDIANVKSLISRNPEISVDARFSLPVVLVPTEAGQVLAVSRWVCHRQTLADELMDLWLRQNKAEILSLCAEFGKFMRQWITDYHGRISHNDCTPTNVLITDDRKFVLVDCLAMDDQTVNDDLNSFIRAIDFLSTIWPQEFTQLVYNGFFSGVNS